VLLAPSKEEIMKGQTAAARKRLKENRGAKSSAIEGAIQEIDPNGTMKPADLRKELAKKGHFPCERAVRNYRKAVDK
jgi:hypothetical protein